jgi:hypothetical protein
MKIEYYLKANTGTYPPSYKHSDLQSAKTEAQRLLTTTNATKIEILAIIGVVEIKDVPVTEKKVVIDLFNNSDLPF